MDNFESTRLAIPGSGKVPLVTTLALQRQVLESDIADLEDLHGHGVMLVLTDGLEQTGQQAGADNLELKSLRVGQLDGGVTVVLAVEPSEVLVVRAQNQGQHLRPACHGSLHAHNIAELVDGERLGNGTGLARERPGKVVEAISDGDILHDVGLVEHVSSRRRNKHINQVLRSGRGLRIVSHLLQERADLFGGELQSAALVEVGDLGLSRTGRNVGDDSSLVVVIRDHLNWLNPICSVSMGPRSEPRGRGIRERLRGVLREHGHNDPVNNLDLSLVKCSDFDEDVLGVQGNLGVIAVDDRRKRADGSLGVVDHWVDGRVADDVEVLAQVLVFLLYSEHLACSSRQALVGHTS